MKSMILNLINGNLTDAKRQAKRHSPGAITDYLREEFGWTRTRAVLAADYLKTGQGFQAYCDAE